MNEFCHKCGSKLPIAAESCPACGAIIISTDLERAEAKYASVQSEAPISASSQQILPPPITRTQSNQNTQYAQNTQYVPAYSPSAQPPISKTLRLGQTVGILLLNIIPLAGMIMMLVFAFGAEARTSISRANLAKALLIMRLVSIALFIITYLFIFVLLIGAGIASNFAY